MTETKQIRIRVPVDILEALDDYAIAHKRKNRQEVICERLALIKERDEEMDFLRNRILKLTEERDALLATAKQMVREEKHRNKVLAQKAARSAIIQHSEGFEALHPEVRGLVEKCRSHKPTRSKVRGQLKGNGPYGPAIAKALRHVSQDALLELLS